MNKVYFYVALASVLLFTATAVHAQDTVWPQFLGPQSNPVGTHAKLADRWSKTENVEWFLDVPGRGWSSPIVTGGKVYLTTVTTDGKSKVPQTGTEYSNEYAAELQRQGLSGPEIMKRLNERDIELRRAGPSYMADTLAELAASVFPEDCGPQRLHARRPRLSSEATEHASKTDFRLEEAGRSILPYCCVDWLRPPRN